jgi:hypothetical protein
MRRGRNRTVVGLEADFLCCVDSINEVRNVQRHLMICPGESPILYHRFDRSLDSLDCPKTPRYAACEARCALAAELAL